jgi:ornithine cyclodeaminase/alanine dehydrogenase-like protein (mu-crystallin family)
VAPPTPPFIDASDLVRLLPVVDAVDVLEAAFRSPRLPTAPQRTHLDVDGGTLLLMPAAGDQGVGVKLVTVAPANPERGLPFVQAVYVLFASGSLEPLAIVDGSALTALRTSAVSGLATKWLARADAHRLVVFGAGTQADAHLDAMVAVRPINSVHVVSRTQARAEPLVERARRMNLYAEVATPDAVADADIVCTCTTSATPVFDGSLVPAGAHVNAVGAFEPHSRELDDAVIERARIVVETREAALAEAGDLLVPIAAGVIHESDIVADLAEVVAGADVRRGSEDVTVFKSVGVAFEDLVVARAAFERVE